MNEIKHSHGSCLTIRRPQNSRSAALMFSSLPSASPILRKSWSRLKWRVMKCLSTFANSSSFSIWRTLKTLSPTTPYHHSPLLLHLKTCPQQSVTSKLKGQASRFNCYPPETCPLQGRRRASLSYSEPPQ